MYEFSDNIFRDDDAPVHALPFSFIDFYHLDATSLRYDAGDGVDLFRDSNDMLAQPGSELDISLHARPTPPECGCGLER